MKTHIIMMILALAVLLVPLALTMLRKRKLIGAANTYDAAVETHDGTVTRTNDVAITARHLLWAAGATPTTTVQLATASLAALGTIDNTETDTGIANTVLLLGNNVTRKMVASGAITAGDRVYQAASGKVAASGSLCVGIALTTTASDDDIVEVQSSVATSANGSAPTLAVAATRTLTAAESGSVVFFGHGTEFAITLPAPAAGLRFRAICTAAPSGASYTIVTDSSANVIKGQITTCDFSGTTDSDFDASGADTITFVDSKAVAGDWVDLVSDGTNWFVTGACSVFDAITLTTAS